MESSRGTDWAVEVAIEAGLWVGLLVVWWDGLGFARDCGWVGFGIWSGSGSGALGEAYRVCVNALGAAGTRARDVAIAEGFARATADISLNGLSAMVRTYSAERSAGGRVMPLL